MVFVVLGFLGMAQAVNAQSYWVADPLDCPSNDFGSYPGQNCNDEDICGIVDGNIDCADTASTTWFSPPTASTTQASRTSAGVQPLSALRRGRPWCCHYRAYQAPMLRSPAVPSPSQAVRLPRCVGLGSSALWFALISCRR